MSSLTEDAIDSQADRVLRAAVERIVRPVVATESRKLKMRRELYTHAIEAYADEATRHADPIVAAQRAADRLGNPGELTAELQSGVSWGNQREAMLDRWMRRDPETPPLRHAAFVAATTAIGFLVFMLTVVGLCEALDVGKGADRIAMQFTVVLAVWFGAGLGVGCWFGGKIRDVLHDTGLKSGGAFRIATLTTSGFLVLLLTGFGVLAILFIGSHGWFAPAAAIAELPLQFYLSWTGLCAMIALAAAPITWLDIRERAGLEEWLEIELD